jgi:ketosteroid isomerase-like protein
MGTAQGTVTQSGAEDVVKSMCERYAAAVSANDSAAYSRLFAADAIRMPPGTDPEYGPEEIRRGEQADYDVARYSIRSTPLEALRIAENWIYGIAQVDGTTTAHADGAQTHFKATKTWLLQRQPSGEWLIARQMWNIKSRNPVTAG